MIPQKIKEVPLVTDISGNLGNLDTIVAERSKQRLVSDIYNSYKVSEMLVTFKNIITTNKHCNNIVYQYKDFNLKNLYALQKVMFFCQSYDFPSRSWSLCLCWFYCSLFFFRNGQKIEGDNSFSLLLSSKESYFSS